MATTSFTALRRLAGIIFTLILFSLCLTGAGRGQTPPPVTASAPAGITHPSGWGAIQQTAIDSNGNWLIMDYGQAGVYEVPASGAAVVTLVPQGGMSNGNGGGNPGILLDPGNNLYIEGNLNNCLLMYPYSSAASHWPLLASTLGLGPTGTVPSQYTNVTTNIASQYCLYDFNVSTNSFTSPPTPPAFAEGSAYTPFSAGSFQPYGLAIGRGSYADSLLIGTQNGGNGIFSLPVSGAWASPVADCTSSALCSTTTPSTAIIKTLTQPAISIAVDPYGNIYFIENSGGLPGVYEIPAGTTGVASDSGLTRVDPSLPNVTGVITDAAGNLYISDGTDGVFMVPAATGAGGSPDTSASVLLTPVPAQGEVAIDPARKILDVPTTQKQNNGQADVAAVGIGHAELGSSPVGTTTPTAVPVNFSFNASVTPASFTIVEAGMTTPEFAITTYSSTSAAPSGYCVSITTTGATTKTLTTYTAQQNCFVSVAYTPSAAGSSSARLLMLDDNNNILASMLVHGTGTGPIGQASPSLESSIGSTLITPTQVATDASDNVYVADPGLGKVLEYAAGSSTPVSIGTSLVSPTGVAVDGAGDVFIADSSDGTVYEVPVGLSGLNAAGQVTLVSGLGTSGLNLAADGLGDLYVADPSNGRVVKLAGIGDFSDGALVQSETMLTAGFKGPSAVAVDSSNNLYIVDGAKLFEIAGGVSAPISSTTPTTVPTTLVSTLTGVTGLATDPSGAVYISSTSGTFRIPLSRGSLSYARKTAVAPDLSSSSSSSVALDRSGNIYVAPTGGSAVRLVSATGALSFTLTPPATSTTATATIMNIGNAPLLVSGYTDLITNDFGLNVSNFTGADGTCVADSTKPATGIAAGSTCNVVVTFDPGAGQSGALTGWVQATSNAANAPITIDTNGTGPILASSQVQVAVGSGPQVIDVPLTVTVTPGSGTGTPTGTVQVTYKSWTVVVPPSCATPPCAPAINPVTVTASSALTLSPTTNSSTATFVLAPVLAGTQTITVGYTGDQTYVASAGSSGSVTVAQSAIAGFIADPNPPPYLPFVEQGNPPSGAVPYGTSAEYWQYSMPVTVNTAAGIPTGTITFNDNSTTCPPGTSANGVGAATCQLASYSGVACPENNGQGVQFVVNNGTSSVGATATLPTTCLQMPPFVTYTPVVSTHYITPVYSGDANFIGATDPVSSVFQVLRSAEVSIATSAPSATSASPAPPVPTSAGSLTVKSGSTASLTLYITPLLGYGFEGKGATEVNSNFPVTLQCDNLPPHSSCTFTYPTSISPYQPSATNSVQICPQPNLDSNVGTAEAYESLAETGGCNANGVGVVTLTINTDVPVGTTTSQNASPVSITLASIFGFGMVGLFFRRRAFQKARRKLMFVLMIVGGALSVSLTACSTTDLAPQAQLSTPTGTYAVSITAAQVGTQCVPQIAGSIPCTTASGGPGQTVYGSNSQVSFPYYINLTVQ